MSVPTEGGYAVILYRVFRYMVPLSEWESAGGLTDHTVSARKDVSNVLPQFHGRSCTTQGPRHASMHLQFPASSSQPRSETWRPRDTRCVTVWSIAWRVMCQMPIACGSLVGSIQGWIEVCVSPATGNTDRSVAQSFGERFCGRNRFGSRGPCRMNYD